MTNHRHPLNAPSSPPSRRPLARKLRPWHAWAGLAAALFLVLTSLTGAVLNYKRPLLQALGLESPPPAEPGRDHPASPATRTAATLTDFPVGFARALEIAHTELGAAPLERVELKLEHGDWFYKVKRRDGAELWISADTGAWFLKGPYEKIRGQAGGAPSKSFDWGKLLLDLHTGRIGGAAGQLLMTAAALVLLFLSLSGLYLQLKSLAARRAAPAGIAASHTRHPPASPEPSQKERVVPAPGIS